ncbi:tRNA (cytidine(34)-2'-O)-methyltransferase [Seleniivibrio woodruffii]|uniref:Putative tRNA (cytidine(34)-2'-O)-methyltransferase n=1 Tax=Seleniivibrio woodruffii TaxID=1078050 RepID=A0A4V2PSH7_9BACT|nr:tRNA (cytidine(34)-2'-O)-methyltransferase [Seleniivibrio woodruffii]TCK62611.1 tRNA (cytidine/uridine-2'-O-)-methyltransferase [Seleniivibrio woodruffii]TVZ36963.1 tRNA (cytidine/uridine-2'-O-)-methyltransferase [Seleniivibrio woodruffii]
MTGLNIVLFEPEIPQNTGNIGRFSVATDSRLILAGKLGFSLDDKYVKRAGLDYWQHVRLETIDTLDGFFEKYPIGNHPYAFLSKFGTKNYTEIPHDNPNLMLIFGRETSGLPDSVQKKYAEHLYRIPTTGRVRSLNLSNAVALVGFDILRRREFAGLDANWMGPETGETYA